ncbi:MAG: hypothetical protein GX184_05445 [Clostridiaceae bacterium]|nr:hypothetical protein [Clostridiaceae bacterium]
MSEILEMFMVILFGVSWPTSIIKSWKARTAKGKSILFLCFIAAGYVCGILSKVLAGNITYVVIFYVLNLLMVSADIVLYYRNKSIDKQNALQK